MDHMAVLIVLAFLCLAEGMRDNNKKLDNVHTAGGQILSLSGPFEGSVGFKGCYQTPSKFFRKRTDSFNNNNECAKFCSEIGKSVIGTSGMECYCLDEIPSGQRNVKQCNARCPDSALIKGPCSGYSCCGGVKKVSLYAIRPLRQNIRVKRRSSTLNIQGCFNDKAANILKNGRTLTRVDSENTLLSCNEFCLDRGFPVCSLRKDHCYCTNVLPLNRLYEGTDGSRECNSFCSGIHGPSGQCVQDQCCGGQQADGRHTYTVFISGNLDVLKQVLRRVQANTANDPNLIVNRVFGGSLCPAGWKRHKLSCFQFSSRKRTFSEAKNDCETKKAHLLTLQNRNDLKFFSKELSKISKGNPRLFRSTLTLWIGLTFNKGTSRWVWMNGEPLTTLSFVSKPSKDNCPSLFLHAVLHGTKCSTEAHYFCQSFVSITVKGKNPTSGKFNDPATFQSYSMSPSFPNSLKQQSTLSGVADKNKILAMTVVQFEEQIKKQMSASSKFLAGSDVLYRNKNSNTPGKFIYQYSATTSTALTVTKSSGGSLAVSLGMEFETSFFGLASNKFSVSTTLMGNWQTDRSRYQSSGTTHLYRFEFPVPARCDVTIAIMKNEMPTSIDWRASFYVTGWLDVWMLGRKKAVDIARLLTGTQRYLYAFGTNDFGDRPTIVPVKTLDCQGHHNQNKKPEPIKQCTNPDTGKGEPCRVSLTP